MLKHVVHDMTEKFPNKTFLPKSGKALHQYMFEYNVHDMTEKLTIKTFLPKSGKRFIFPRNNVLSF